VAEFVYLNGKIVPEARAVVSVFDRGLVFGDGVFETLKSENGIPLFAREHFRRLCTGLRAIGISKSKIECLVSDVQSGALFTLLRKNGLMNSPASIRITVTRGVEKKGFAPRSTTTPTVIIYTRRVNTKEVTRAQTEGLTGALIKEYGPALPGIKSLNFLPNVLGRGEANRKGLFEGIFVDPEEGVTEGTASNIFVVKNGKIKTPIAGHGIARGGALPGVTRAVVIKLAKRKKIPVTEGRITEAELLRADEVFLTNTLWEIAPIKRIEKKKIGDVPGPITELLQEAYRGVVR
jgi:branched-chain amino acid aminotransferase